MAGARAFARAGLEPEPEYEVEPEPPPVAEQDTAEIEALPEDSGVTASVDWDEDAESYSAPV